MIYTVRRLEISGMTISFTVKDRATGTPLNGTLYWTEYQTTWAFPIVNGIVEVASTGCFTGAEKRFRVHVPGYVDHEDWFLQHDGRVFEVRLSQWWWYEAPPVEPEEPAPPAPSLSPLLLLGAGALALLSR